MKRILKLTGIILVLTLSSCASMKLTTVSEPCNKALFEQLKGKSLSVETVELDLASSRQEFDLRGASITINGQTIELGDTYLERTEDMDLGEVGVVDTNIFKKAGLNSDELGGLIEEKIIAMLDENVDIYLPVNRTQPDVGLYSNYAVVYDYSTIPYTYSVLGELPELETALNSVMKSDSGADYKLELSVIIQSEILQVLNIDQFSQSRFSYGEHVPQNGDYYLSLLLTVKYELSDNKTGEKILDQRTKLDSYLFQGLRDYIYIPVEAGNKDKYSRFFRDFDFSSYAEKLCNLTAEGVLPALRPLYLNMNKWVKVEEEE